MKSRAFALLAVPILLGAAACAGGAEAQNGVDAGAGGAPPLGNCASDSNCGATAGCVAGRCVQRLTDVGKWAIEIEPPAGSGSQITEIPAAANKTATLTASAPLTLMFQFVTGTGSAATIPQPGAVLLSVPSAIPGRPDLSFQTNLQPGAQIVNVVVPEAIRGRSATVTLLPLPPADQTFPPYTFTVMIPLPGGPLQPLQVPGNPSTISGHLQDSLGNPKPKYTARAFQGNLLVSTAASTNTGTTNQPGDFALAMPAGVGTGNAAGVTVQLIPDAASADPSISVMPFPLSQADTDLGMITLPSYAVANAFQVTAHGNDAAKTPAVGATIRAFTTLQTDDVRLTAQFLRDAYTDGTGLANLSLIPGDSSVARSYVLSIVPAAGSVWAAQCLTDDVHVLWHGTTGAPVLLQDVTLQPRPVVSGTVVSAGGSPVANVVVTATGGASPAPSCLAGPTTSTVTTTSSGSFSLPLDPGTYTLDYDPPGGSSVPRMTKPGISIGPIATIDLGLVQFPVPALVEGDVQSTTGDPIPNAPLRIFDPACDMAAGCTVKPILRAQTQTDANGHFRAVVASSPSN